MIIIVKLIPKKYSSGRNASSTHGPSWFGLSLTLRVRAEVFVELSGAAMGTQQRGRNLPRDPNTPLIKECTLNYRGLNIAAYYGLRYRNMP